MGILEGKTAVVTGAAVGLGNAFARALAAEGASLGVCDVRHEIVDFGIQVDVDVLAMRADVSDAAQVKSFIDATLGRFGRIDVLVSNAGVWAETTATDGIGKTLADVPHVVGTNLKGVFLCGRAVIRHARRACRSVRWACDEPQRCRITAPHTTSIPGLR